MKFCSSDSYYTIMQAHQSAKTDDKWNSCFYVLDVVYDLIEANQIYLDSWKYLYQFIRGVFYFIAHVAISGVFLYVTLLWTT